MTRSDLRNDERGLALGVVVFFAMIIVAALLYIAFNTAWVDVVGVMEGQATSEGATDQINEAKAIWNNIMYVPLLFGLVFLIARAVREGSVP